MPKFTIKVELQGLKIEIEGSKEDAPLLAKRVGEQIGNLIKPALLLEPSSPSRSNQESADSDTSDRIASKRRRAINTSGTKTPAQEVNLAIDASQHGTPRQSWTGAQKAIWFMWAAKESGHTGGLTASSIANGFNKHFKAAGKILSQNIARDLDKERLKGPLATVGADTNEGSAKYFLTDTGLAMAKTLATAAPTT